MIEAIEKNYSQDHALSIHLKKAHFASVRCLYVMSLFKNMTPKLWCAAPIYTKPKMEERGVAGRLLVWRKGNWCGSTTTLYSSVHTEVSDHVMLYYAVQLTAHLE